ncbi:hypothetical protein, partial [Vibrio parahaemolyticus]|uniref:hypothetical protein n=1 Tax=Vibrio parahaemolyticus TaxID=670 RepID=UPI000A1EB634
LGHSSTATASRTLKKLCAEQLVKKVHITEEHINVTLFGISKEGVGQLSCSVDEQRHFIPSRVSFRNLHHTLANQRAGTVVVNFLKNSNVEDIKVINTEFGNLKKYNHIVKFNHRPDLLIVGYFNGKPTLFVIETELSLKDSKRYRKIWFEYMKLKQKGLIKVVWYFMKNESAVEKIEKIKNSLNFNSENKKLLDEVIVPIDITKKI